MTGVSSGSFTFGYIGLVGLFRHDSYCHLWTYFVEKLFLDCGLNY